VRAAAFTREVAQAGVGVGRLISYDPRWPEGFDPSFDGFLRSFLAPVLALPFYLVVASLFRGEDGGSASLWAAAVSHGVNALAFPAVVGLLARPFGFGGGYAGFIVIVNWASLFLNMGAAAASALIPLGDTGYRLFTVLWLWLFAASLFITWRAARETLSSEIAPALLMVVLSVGIGVLSDQLSGWAFKLVGG